MVKTISWLLAGLVAGACLMYAQQYFFGGSEPTGGDPNATAEPGEGAAPSGHLGAPGASARLAAGDPVTPGAAGLNGSSSVDPGGGLAPAVHRAQGGSRVGDGGASVRPALPDPRVAYHATRPAAHSTRAGGLEAVAAQAEDALRRGATDQAISLLRGLVSRAAADPNGDFSGPAMTLLRIDRDPKARRDSLQYLQSRGLGAQAFEDQLNQASVLASSTDSEAVRRAWSDLSIAYEVASDANQRARVLAVLRPFLDRNVFARRLTPLLTKYTVKPGDTLLRIAIQHETTVDAIQFLNALSGEHIQPRMSLFLLQGKVRLVVDKSDYRLWLTVDDNVLFHFDVGLGRENRTPVADFVIRVKKKDPDWFPPGGGRIPAGDPRNVLGTRWLGFEDTDEHMGFGIHGTGSAGDVGAESSSGCVRLLTADMERLFNFVPRGTPVSIRD